MSDAPESPDAPMRLVGVPKPSLGSQEVLKKVAEFSKPKPAATVDEFTGKKTCHRFMIPAHYLTPSKRPGALMGEADLNVQMGFVTCLGSKCALFNSHQLECLDVTVAKAGTRVPSLIEQIDGFMRLHSVEG